jgi:hypothetical protein
MKTNLYEALIELCKKCLTDFLMEQKEISNKTSHVHNNIFFAAG